MKYSKELLEQLKRGEITEEVMVMNIMAANPLQDIIKFCIEALKKEPSTQGPITLSPEDYERVLALFRPRGVKIVDGEEVSERRGRPRKMPLTSPFDNKEE
jgi:hypothetical protein